MISPVLIRIRIHLEELTTWLDTLEAGKWSPSTYVVWAKFWFKWSAPKTHKIWAVVNLLVLTSGLRGSKVSDREWTIKVQILDIWIMCFNCETSDVKVMKVVKALPCMTTYWCRITSNLDKLRQALITGRSLRQLCPPGRLYAFTPVRQLGLSPTLTDAAPTWPAATHNS